MNPIDLDIDDYQDAVKAFHSETDRAAAVLAGSFLESFLAKFLRSYMIQDPTVDELFDGFGPFADFKKRLECAYAFGIISKQQRKDLDFIRKIRNHFAHHPLKAGFDQSPVSEWCNNLSTKDLYPLEGHDPSTKDDNRNRYLVSIGLCIGAWQNNMLDQEQESNPYKIR